MGELYLKRKIDLFLSEWKKNPERKLQTETHTVIGQEKIKRMPVTEASRMAVY